VSAAGAVVVVAAIVAVAVVIAWFVFGRNDPEDAASHGEADRTGTSLHHGDVDDRPAGPGAEADGVAGRGEPVPGPSAEGDPRP